MQISQLPYAYEIQEYLYEVGIFVGIGIIKLVARYKDRCLVERLHVLANQYDTRPQKKYTK